MPKASLIASLNFYTIGTKYDDVSWEDIAQLAVTDKTSFTWIGGSPVHTASKTNLEKQNHRRLKLEASTTDDRPTVQQPASKSFSCIAVSQNKRFDHEAAEL